jgi:hypothetical protein
MKKGFILVCILLGFLWACTDSPTEPGVPGGGGSSASGYSVTITPAQGSAFITGAPPPSMENQTIEITATVRKDGAIVSERLWVAFEIIGSGAAFVESGNAHYSTYTANGAARATLYSTVIGTFTVKATVRVSDNTSINTSGSYSFGESTILTITGVSPAMGTSAGGTSVTITGSGFKQPLEVYFGARRANFVSGTTTEMTVTTPVHYPSDCNANDSVDVKVVVFPGQVAEASVTAEHAYNYLFEPLSPSITGIDPNHGTNNGGTRVTIYGSGFHCGGGVLVYFNQVAGRIISCAPDKIVVETPTAQDAGIANCTQTIGVRVLNLCGGLSFNLSNAYSYGPEILITAWGPRQGSASGGNIVTIYGQGFDAPMAVSLAGVGATVLSVSNNEMRVMAGGYDPQGKCGNYSDVISVTDIECGITVETDDQEAYTYVSPELFISGISPAAGLADTLVTLSGSGMIPPLEVKFGQTNASVVTVSDDFTTATVLAPIFPGPYLSQTCTTVPDGCPGNQALPTPVDVVVRSLYTGCTYTYKSFFYNPINPSCLPAPPTCTMTATFGAAPACTATFSVTPQCGATYDWTGVCGVVAGGSNLYSCAVTDADSPATASVIITNAGGAATCSGSVAVTGGP